MQPKLALPSPAKAKKSEWNSPSWHEHWNLDRDAPPTTHKSVYYMLCTRFGELLYLDIQLKKVDYNSPGDSAMTRTSTWGYSKETNSKNRTNEFHAGASSIKFVPESRTHDFIYCLVAQIIILFARIFRNRNACHLSGFRNTIKSQSIHHVAEWQSDRAARTQASHEVDLILSYAVSTGNSCMFQPGKDGQLLVHAHRDLLQRDMIIISAIRRAFHEQDSKVNKASNNIGRKSP